MRFFFIFFVFLIVFNFRNRFYIKENIFNLLFVASTEGVKLTGFDLLQLLLKLVILVLKVNYFGLGVVHLDRVGRSHFSGSLQFYGVGLDSCCQFSFDLDHALSVLNELDTDLSEIFLYVAKVAG